MKKTPWYPASIKPVRVGMYMCNREFSIGSMGDEMLFWNGEDWYYPAGKVIWAQMTYRDKWRGLTEKAK